MNAARGVFDEVEAAVLGRWSEISTECGVPKGMVETWAKEMATQTRDLRADVNRTRATRRTIR